MALRPASLPGLGVFAVAARHQNFAHAAEELGLTASAVSHHVRKLETLLGVKLFQRHARGVALSLEGRSLADAATAALSDIDAVALTLSTRARDVSRVRLATLHSLTYSWLLPRLRRFFGLHPLIRVSIETGGAITRFDDTGPDLAIRYGAGYWPGLTAHHLMDEWLFPAAAPGLKGVRGIENAAQIAALPLVSDLAFEGWREWFRAAGVRGLHLPEMHTFTDTTDAVEAAILELGAILARSRIVAPYLREGKLIRLPGPALKGRFGYYAIHPSHRRPSAATTELIGWLLAEAARDESEVPAFLE